MKRFILIIIFSLLATLIARAGEEKPYGWICPECDGEGVILTACIKCRSTGICKYCKGVKPELCSRCFGKKGAKCKRCDGQGYKIYSGSRKRDCNTCKGTGIILCKKCKGQGKIRCRYCQGTGMCSACSGRGRIPKQACSACGGAGGKWRDLALKDLVKQNGGHLLTERAVLSGLIWLARHQDPAGGWGAEAFQEQCPGTKCSKTGAAFFDIGLTGLALLAFTGANYSPGSKDTYQGLCFGDVVSRAAQYLNKKQADNGRFGVPQGEFMYNQAIATYALADLVNLMKDKGEDPSLFYQSAQKGVDAILEAQNPGKAWRYTPKCGASDVSVTGWCVNALRIAQEIGLDVPDTVWAGVKNHLNDVTDETYGMVGYVGKGGVCIISREEEKLYREGDIHIPPSLPAIGILMRLFMGETKKSKAIEDGIGLLMTNLPTWDTSLLGKIDYYYWYHGSCAMYNCDGPEGNRWKKWNKTMKEVLLKHQKTDRDGCANGSWDPVDRWSNKGGRIYATAMSILTLEVYYRFTK